MNSEIYLIDNYANNIDSVIHRSSYVLKLIFTLFTLMLIIFTRDPLKLGGYIVLIMALIVLAKLPVMKLLKWSLYPVIFGSIFAASQAFHSPASAGVTLLRVFATVLLMLSFAASSGFAKLFSLMPSATLRNTFFLTYRFFFMIIASLGQRLNMIKVRGIGSASWLRKLTAISDIIAHQLIHTVEKAERVYSIMKVRGFSGKVSMPIRPGLGVNDLVFILFFGGAMLLWML